MNTHEEYTDIDIQESLQKERELKLALGRLFSNSDFKTIILDGYINKIKEESIKGIVSEDINYKDNVLSRLKSVGHLCQYFSSIDGE